MNKPKSTIRCKYELDYIECRNYLESIGELKTHDWLEGWFSDNCANNGDIIEMYLEYLDEEDDEYKRIFRREFEIPDDIEEVFININW